MTTPIPLLDLVPLYEEQRAEIDAAIQDVLTRHDFIQGSAVRALEAAVVDYVRMAHGHGIGVANGSDAIVIALRALGIGAGDEVIVPDFTFLSTATSVSLVGATPVFVDVSGASFNLRPEDVVAGLSPTTRAVIIVHLFGGAADVPGIRAALDAADRSDVRIIEDCAQSLGAEWDGHRVTTMGDIATISFFPSKNLGGFGDGGMIVTADPELAESCRMFSQHGSRTKYYAEVLGQNSRLDTLQAAILLPRLRHLDMWCDTRRHNASRYLSNLQATAERTSSLRLPWELPGCRHIFNQFTIVVDDRPRWIDAFKSASIGHAVYYPRRLSEQPCFAPLPHRALPTPNAAALCEQVMSIPIYPGLSGADIDRVSDLVIQLAEGRA